jgi:hypothetical protein
MCGTDGKSGLGLMDGKSSLGLMDGKSGLGLMDGKAKTASGVCWRDAPEGRVSLKRGGVEYPMRLNDVKALIEQLYDDDWSRESDVDAASAKRANADGASTLFGEVMPAGVAKICDDQHLRASQARVFLDFGAGRGKLALQVPSKTLSAV